MSVAALIIAFARMTDFVHEGRASLVFLMFLGPPLEVGLRVVLKHLGYTTSRFLARCEKACASAGWKPSEWARAAYRRLRNNPDCEDRVDDLEPHNGSEGYAIRDTSDAPSEQNAAPRKLTKSERRAAGKERERVQEAERREAERRRIQQDRELKRERRRRGEEEAAAKRAAEIDAAAAQRDAEYDRVYDRWERNAQKREARDIKALFHALPPSSPQVTYYGSYTYNDSDYYDSDYAYSKLPPPSSTRPSRSDKADAEDRLQTQRNQEEAEARRRVREQRELEKAAQMAPAYSESGPSHKPGAPKWVDEPLDDADKAKREAEKAASLARRREQKQRKVERKEQHEKRLSARAKSYKTGERILQGDRGGSGASTARSSLQPVREDELTGTLEDFVPMDDPCFHVDDDAVSVATTAVPLVLTQHAAQRMDERGIAPHDAKKAIKHGRVVPSTTVEGVYRHEGPEGGPCVVTNADGRVLTAYPARCGG